MAVALVRPVIEDRLVLRAAIVPEGDRVLLPFEAAGQFWRFNVLEQEGEQRVALRLTELDNARCEPAIDKQQLAAGHRMHTHHRMLETWKLHVAALAGLAMGMCFRGIMDRG